MVLYPNSAPDPESKRKILLWFLRKILSLSPVDKKPGIFCGCGVIGSRARLRIWCREAWGFESLHPHKKRNRQVPFFIYKQPLDDCPERATAKPGGSL